MDARRPPEIAPRGPRPWFRCGLCGRRFGKIYRRLSQHLQLAHHGELAPKVWLERTRPELLTQWRPEFDERWPWLVGDKLYTDMELIKKEMA